MKRGIARVLVTSGPTRAYIDRVRYISNISSGALGARVVEALVSKGLGVKLLIGPGAEQPGVPGGRLLETVAVTTVEDLIEQVRSAAAGGDIRAVVHAMAVLDYVPERRIEEKHPSDSPFWDIRLVRTRKVTALIRELMPDAYTIGFKLEAGVSESELVRRAYESLRKHRLDLVVANDLDRVGAEAHEAIFIDSGGAIIDRASTKREIAEKITGCILTHRPPLRSIL
jgi:phosphopantothenoylcysteine synthetase/decarboxylase